MNRVFLLSPANCGGLRARLILKNGSRSKLAAQLRDSGAPLCEVFSFFSSLYFRGKLDYARSFARPPADCPGIWIITPTAGLLPHDALIQMPRLRSFGRAPIRVDNRRYCASLQRTAKRLAAMVGADCELVLLGSLATKKYLEILRPIFGNRLRVPVEFIGLGNMSRGGLMLRCVRENRELAYVDAAVVDCGRSSRGLSPSSVSRDRCA